MVENNIEVVSNDSNNSNNSNKGNIRVISNNGNNSNESNKLYPAGGIISQDLLVYEPLGNYYYIYNKDGNKGISRANIEPTSKEWSILFDNETHYFNGKPLNKLLFKTPSNEIMKDYLEDIYPIKSGEQIQKDLLNYFKIVLDLPKSHYYYNPTIITLQSWLRNILKSLIYIGFEAKFGAGKTKGLEGLSTVCYHGYLVGDISQAGISRIVNAQKLSIFVDELDVASGSKDNEVYKTFRQGHRRNNPYVRLKEKNYEPEVCDVFGTKGFTFSSDIEKALKQRSLITPMRKTEDKRLPIIDMYIQELGYKIFEDLFFWYLDNIIISLRSLPLLPYLPHFPNKEIDVDGVRKELYDTIIKNLTDDQKKFLDRFTGRNIELSFNIILISKIFKIDLLSDLEIIFEEKEEADSIYDENALITILREVLYKIYNENKENYKLGKGDFEGRFYYPKNLIYEQYRIKLKEKELYLIGQDRFKKYLQEIGFQDSINIKRENFDGRNLLCLIFDNFILKDIIREEIKNEKNWSIMEEEKR